MHESRLTKGLRAVALFEIAKGSIGLWIGWRLLKRGKDYVVGGAEWLVHHLHLDATQGVGQHLLDFVNHMDHSHVVMFISLAFAYTAVRFIEAYGLWRERAWAEWFAVISAGLYVPVEMAEVIRHVLWWKVMLLGANVGIVAFLVKVLMEARRAKALAAGLTATASPPA